MAAGLGGAIAAPGALRAPGAWPGGAAIRVIVPFAEGSAADAAFAAMLPFLAAQLPGARFTVVRQAGTPPAESYAALAQAAPDGFTIGVVVTPGLQVGSIEPGARYTMLDFIYLGSILEDPSAFFVAADSPLRDVAALVRAAQAAPGTIAVGTGGIGSDDHLLMVEFEDAAGIRFRHVPFAQDAQIIAALAAGQIQVASMKLGGNLGLVSAGRARALAAAGPHRYPLATSVPTFTESGYPIDTRNVMSLAAPAATPLPILARLELMLAETMRNPAWIEAATRLRLPLAYQPAAATRQIVIGADAALRALWTRHPWRAG
jgi:tripartite-type tricarboxylate transporter receptor subunit TctC